MRLFLLALLATVLQAQDDTRTSALKQLEHTLSGQTSTNWVQTPTDSAKAADAARVTASITDVHADAGACTLSFKDGRGYPDQKYESVQSWKLNLSDVDRIQVESMEGFVNRLRAEHGQRPWETKNVPTVYVLLMAAAPDRNFKVHRWSKSSNNEVAERDLSQPLAFVVFAAEAAAREAASTLQKAKDLCK